MLCVLMGRSYPRRCKHRNEEGISFSWGPCYGMMFRYWWHQAWNRHSSSGMADPCVWVGIRENNSCPAPAVCKQLWALSYDENHNHRLVILSWSSCGDPGRAPEGYPRIALVTWFILFHFCWFAFSLPLCLPSHSTLLQNKQPNPSRLFFPPHCTSLLTSIPKSGVSGTGFE